MTWDEAHRYNAALRQVREDLQKSAGDRLVWRPEYRDIFGTKDRLVAALRSRWQTTVHAQISDAVIVNGCHSDEMLALALQHRAVLRLLAKEKAIDWVDAELDALGTAA
jgi:hypothetical protein